MARCACGGDAEGQGKATDDDASRLLTRPLKFVSAAGNVAQFRQRPSNNSMQQ